ncbi:MAG TPA: L,D-transpeptidase family protein [Hyphomicrobiaceae bacterium]|nr:L,D-transpeptidase family protein [Hyphomicrobiaceae bacterium]
MGKFSLALLLVVCCGLSQTALGQSAKAPGRPALDLDAGAYPESGPDPLTPPPANASPLLAPGAAGALSEAGPSRDADPIVQAVRQRLATAPAARDSGEQADAAALKAFYAQRAGALWLADAVLTPRAEQTMLEISQADSWGLKTSVFDLPKVGAPAAEVEALADVEIKLSLAVLKYARAARGGRFEPATVSRKFDQKPPVYDPGSLLLAVAEQADVAAYLRQLHPRHPQFAHLRQALLATRAGPADANTAATVRRLIVNLERWRWMPDDLGDFYVWDSVPEQVTRVVDRGEVTLSEKIVVGKPSTPTPIFSANMQFVIFHPSWGVPAGMKTQELWPQLRNTGGGWFSSYPLASAVLAGHGLFVSRGGQPINPDAVDWSKVDIREFEFVQPPGPKNVLGIVKFRFPNKHDVYMHDTPERHLFGGAMRAFSHGCMRVQNPIRLAEVLLAHDKGWTASDVQGYVRRGGEIALKQSIPVHVTYFTAVADDAGKVQYFPDIYGLDDRLASALEGARVSLAATPETPARQSARAPARASSRAPQKVKAPPSSNPLAAIFWN